MVRPGRDSRPPTATAKLKREQARKAEEQKQRRTMAIGLNASAVILVGAMLAMRSRSLGQTGHFRVPASLLLFTALLLVAAAWSSVSWLHNR